MMVAVAWKRDPDNGSARRHRLQDFSIFVEQTFMGPARVFFFPFPPPVVCAGHPERIQVVAMDDLGWSFPHDVGRRWPRRVELAKRIQLPSRYRGQAPREGKASIAGNDRDRRCDRQGLPDLTNIATPAARLCKAAESIAREWREGSALLHQPRALMHPPLR